MRPPARVASRSRRVRVSPSRVTPRVAPVAMSPRPRSRLSTREAEGDRRPARRHRREPRARRALPRPARGFGRQDRGAGQQRQGQAGQGRAAADRALRPAGEVGRDGLAGDPPDDRQAQASGRRATGAGRDRPGSGPGIGTALPAEGRGAARGRAGASWSSPASRQGLGGVEAGAAAPSRSRCRRPSRSGAGRGRRAARARRPGRRAPARRRRPGRRRAGTSVRPNQAAAFAVAMVRSRVSMRPARLRRSRSRVPPAALPLAADPQRVGRARIALEVDGEVEGARAAGRPGRGRASATQTRSRSANRGAATAAETCPAIRPVPSGAIRPESLALAPARSVMSRLSTTRLGPSDWMLAAMVPLPAMRAGRPVAHVPGLEGEPEIVAPQVARGLPPRRAGRRCRCPGRRAARRSAPRSVPSAAV